MVDTPGFGVELDEEEEIISGLVDFLKNELKFVHAFVLTFKETDKRLTAEFKLIVRLLSGIFGDQFWENVIIEVTHWSYHESNTAKRTQYNESTWTDNINHLFEGIAHKKMSSVFIDTYYNDTSAREREEFEKNTKKLFDFAVEHPPFPCKDIKQWKHEWRVAQEQLANVTEINNTLKEEIKKIKEEKNKSKTPDPEPVVQTSFTSSILVTGILVIIAFSLGVLVSFWYKSTFKKEEQVIDIKIEYQ